MKTGASVDFEIAPAYYQTTWFMALVAGMLLTLVWAAHRLRLRIVETHEREITALNEKLMSAQEQERIRIAGELHDGVMQEMLAATMMLGSAKRRFDGNDRRRRRPSTRSSRSSSRPARKSASSLTTCIRRRCKKQGLPDALRSHCEQFSASCGIPIMCDADDRVHELSRGAALALFRIVQEALGNAAKHSQATRITVGLMRSADDGDAHRVRQWRGLRSQPPDHLGRAGTDHDARTRRSVERQVRIQHRAGTRHDHHGRDSFPMNALRRRRVVARMLLAAVAWSAVAPAFALNPRLDISSTRHTAWRVSDGFPAAEINDIVQTPDGYLWLGTNHGLFRFDGIKATPWQPPSGQALPSNRIRFLEVTRDGALWISTEAGLVSWRNGGLTFHKGPGKATSRARSSRTAMVLSGEPSSCRGSITGCSAVSETHRPSVMARTAAPESDAIGLFEDSKGQLWVGSDDGVWRWKPAPARFYSLGSETSGRLPGDGGGRIGALLISMRGRVVRLADGRVDTLHRFPPAIKDLQFTSMVKDRDGALWLSRASAGLFHLHQGVMDTFREVDGLTSDIVSAVFEDREGNVWVGTAEGLHRFRDVAVATVSTRQGLPSPPVNGLSTSADGGVWISTRGALTKTYADEVIVYGERGPIAAPSESRVFRSIRYVAGAGVPGAIPHSIFRDGRGRIWVATERGVGHLDNDRFVKAKGVPGGVTRGVAEDGDGTIWIVNQDRGVFALTRGREVAEATTWAALGLALMPMAVAADPRRGVWVAFLQGDVLHIDGEVRAAYGQKDGLPGRVSNLRFDTAGTLWIATEGGLTRVKAGRLATLNAAGGLPCDHVQWTLTDDAGSLWLAMPCGLVRVSSADLAAWEAAADRQDTNRRVQATVLGIADGFRFTGGSRILPAGG